MIMETDPEKGVGEYSFDNPGFKDVTLTPVETALEKSKLESPMKTKWNQWPQIGVLSSKNERKRTFDDSKLEDQEKIVSLRSHDFTGLGFNICGNMKEGIFIRDVLNKGPAFESKLLSSGDRITSVTIDFEHIVYEDALAILSYASPYEVVISAKNKKGFAFSGPAKVPRHLIFRSSSNVDLSHKSKRTAPLEENSSEIDSNYSSLQKSRSTVTTLERTKSKSPKPMPKLNKMKAAKPETPPRVDSELQRSENKHQKFGIKVLPAVNVNERSNLKSTELLQNDNNLNIESTTQNVDEVDRKQPPIKKREKINKVVVEPPQQQQEQQVEDHQFDRQNVLNSSGIKRDENNIPLEIPSTMLYAAAAARKNRKTVEEEDVKSPKRKGKAPAPPPENRADDSTNYMDEEEEMISSLSSNTLNKSDDSIERMNPDVSNVIITSDMKDYNSDSDIEVDNQSSVNTIELNASDITVHQSEENEDRQNRKTASTGDLTKIKSGKTSTLERAQSLDITDNAMPTLPKKRKSGKSVEDNDSKTSSDESLYRNAIINKEPRLSLILDGLNTFQRNRLKKSSEWGNLEDAILRQDESSESLGDRSSFEDLKISMENISTADFGAKSEFDALVSKINEIKQETIDIINGQDRSLTQMRAGEEVFEELKINDEPIEVVKTVKNQIWPIFENNVETGERIMKPMESFEANLIIPEDKYEEVKMDSIETVKEVVSHKPTITHEITKPITQASSKEIEDFLLAERIANTRNYVERNDTNVPDDLKVSRHSLESLERQKINNDNISNITILETSQPQFQVNINETEIKYDSIPTNMDNVTISTPDLIKNITISDTSFESNAEVTVDCPTSLTFEITGDLNDLTSEIDLKEPDFSSISEMNRKLESDSENSSSLTYITEIQVMTPNNKERNVSEIEIVPSLDDEEMPDMKNLDNEFENYLKKFEHNIQNFEHNINSFEKTIQDVEETVKKDTVQSTKSIIINDKVDPAKELQKVQEIVEEQLKKLPEMRFTTSSYESQIRAPETRQSQIEILRSNFEKPSVAPKSLRSEVSPPKSRIPVLNKTPPTSPERRDSKILDTEPDKELLEMMSSHIPINLKHQPKAAARNITVTSIRTNSKLPSGLPTYSSRPPVPPKRGDSEDNLVQISTNGSTENFKQWVFNPNHSSVTNITVTDTKFNSQK